MLGSRWKGKPVGAFGDLVTFSFHPNKNITSIEGGALVVNRRGRSGTSRDAALPRHHVRGRSNARCRVPRRQVQPARRECAHRLRAARAACRAFSPTGDASSTDTSSACATDPACVLPPRPQHAARRRLQLEHVLRPACRSTARADATAGSRCARCARDRDGHVVRGAAPVHARQALRRPSRDSFQTRSASPRRRVTLPLHTAMTEADVDRVCAAVGDDHCRGEEMTMQTPQRLGRHSRLQRGSRPAGAVRPALSCPRSSRRRLRGHLRQRRQPRPLGGDAEGTVRPAAGRDAGDPVQRQLRPAHGDRRRLRALSSASASSRWTPTCRIRPRKSASCSPRWTPATITWAAFGAPAKIPGGAISPRRR